MRYTLSIAETTKKLSTWQQTDENRCILRANYRETAAMAIHVKIWETESIEDIARKIYFNFDVGASCTIYGFVSNGDSLVPKGESIVERIRFWDRSEHVNPSGQRIYKFRNKSNNIGGPISQKIFSWETRVVDKEPRVTIWRIQ